MGGMSAIEKSTKKKLNFKVKEAEKFKDALSQTGGAKDTTPMQHTEAMLAKEKHWNHFNNLTTFLAIIKDKLLLTRKVHDTMGKQIVSISDLRKQKEAFTD
jgi:hypothetical protein